MKKMFLMALVLSASSAFAHENDMVLPGAKWVAKFKSYVCAAFGPEMSRPAAFEERQVVFETMTTDSTLDNGLLLASFVENGTACRYNALILADNAAATLRLVESKAFATEGAGDCSAGQAMLDGYFAANNYLYYGHPHNLAIMAPVGGSRELCGADMIGVNFVVAGRISK